jgi:DNA-binding NarL/FixJ family response regulator
MNSRFYNDFHEILKPEDNEKVILRKLEKQVRSLIKPDPATNQPEEISEREKDVLKLVAVGMTNKEIAEKLYISSHTVITHRKNITSKLGIKTIAGLTVYAIIHKLVSF